MTEHIKQLIHKNDLSVSDFIATIDELPLWSAPFGMTLLEKIHYKKGMHVLDVGFGTGFPMLEIAQRLGSSSSVFGIDPWEDAVERLMLKIKVFDVKNIQVITGYAEQMPYAGGSMDLLVSNNGLNNVADIYRVLAECYRVLKPDGTLIFTINLPASMIEFYTVLENILKENGLTDSVEKMYAHIAAKRKSTEEWKSLLKQSGFVIDNLEEKEFVLKYADGTAMLQHHFIRLAFLESWKELVSEDLVKNIFDHLELRLNEQAAIKNGIALTIPFACFVCNKQA